MNSGADMLSCKRVRDSFSAYLDGAVTGVEMQALGAHLNSCAGCAEEWSTWRGMQRVLASTGQAKAPVDLGLQLRLAISHENTKRQRRWHAFSSGWENLVRPVAVQMAGGLAAALLLIGGIATLVGVAPVANPVLANDEPLNPVTMPHYLYSAAHQQALAPNDQTIVVEASVNAEGRVYDYKVVSGPVDDETNAELRDEMMLEVYEPARMLGQPVRGQVLVTFSGVVVRG